MNKDDYAMLKARQEIVKAFMDKLDKTSMGEASIIPALMDYVQTGNRKLFDDYRMYLETTTIEERIKRAEEANAKVEERAKASADYAEEKIGWHEARKKRAEERLNEVDIELQNIYNVIEEKENAYNEKMHAYRDRMNEIRKAEFDDIDCTEYMTMKNLQDFCAKVIADGGFPNKARKLWAMKDGKLYCVKGLTVLDNGKAVFSIDDDSAIPPKP